MIENIDEQIRKAIGDIIRATVDPQALVYDYWVLGYETTQWLGFVRKPDGRAHGYLITRRQVQQISDGASTDELWSYAIIGMFSYYTEDGQRSEDVFSVEIDKLLMVLRPEKILTLESGDEVRLGDSFLTLDLFPFGGNEKAHYFLLNLDVRFSIC